MQRKLVAYVPVHRRGTILIAVRSLKASNAASNIDYCEAVDDNDDTRKMVRCRAYHFGTWAVGSHPTHLRPDQVVVGRVDTWIQPIAGKQKGYRQRGTDRVHVAPYGNRGANRKLLARHHVIIIRLHGPWFHRVAHKHKVGRNVQVYN